jgi:hypothetical protein
MHNTTRLQTAFVHDLLAALHHPLAKRIIGEQLRHLARRVQKKFWRSECFIAPAHGV